MHHKVVGLISTAILTAGFATAVSAADLAVKAPVYKAPVVPAFSWTGCYIGAEAGGIWGHSRHTDADPTDPDFGVPISSNGVSGGLVGGTAGCNFQFSNNWVLGVENDFSWTNAEGTGPDLPPFTAGGTNQTRMKWLDTMRGRLGYAWNRAFFYGTGGLAYADTAVKVCVFDCTEESRTRSGWVVGAGVEYAPTAWEHVTVKLEYLHADFGTKSFFTSPNAVAVPADVTLTNDIVRAGINYRF
jgi:outer membrane immunogenic protein